VVLLVKTASQPLIAGGKNPDLFKFFLTRISPKFGAA
jgi:hypothetical protein